jgi:uncharacterized short protein YbdD (DUF466 family)
MWDRWGGETAGPRGGWARIGSVIRRVAGMPDYRAHVEHLRRCHPDRALPSEREYFEQFVKVRYGEGSTRCC